MVGSFGDNERAVRSFGVAKERKRNLSDFVLSFPFFGSFLQNESQGVHSLIDLSKLLNEPLYCTF
jgi:hypothetical protein